MNDERLHELLKTLPREQASPSFTARVLARCRAESAPVRRAPLWRPAWSAAVAVALGLGLLVSWQVYEARQAEALRAARLASLLEEQRRLEQELGELRRYAREPTAQVYLGGDERTDLVLDLGELARRAERGGYRPAGWQP
jgi:hypothetical protein